jgi:hypothetical protein
MSKKETSSEVNTAKDEVDTAALALQYVALKMREDALSKQIKATREQLISRLELQPAPTVRTVSGDRVTLSYTKRTTLDRVALQEFVAARGAMWESFETVGEPVATLRVTYQRADDTHTDTATINV